MKRYSFANLAIASEVPIAGLRRPLTAAVYQPDITISISSLPAPVMEKLHFSWPGRYGLSLGEWNEAWIMTSPVGGTVAISQVGRRITIFTDTLPLSPATVDVFVRRILPRVAMLFGATAVHAATLETPSGAIMLLGPSGAGKSTMTAALAHILGWEIYSDDISIIWDGDVATMASAASGVCVWPDSAVGLSLPADHCWPMPGYDGKVRFAPTADPAARSVRLAGMIFLNRQSAPSVLDHTRLTPAEAVAKIVPQMIRFNPSGTGGAERAVTLDVVRRALLATPAWRLTYSADFEALQETAGCINQLLAESAACPHSQSEPA
jgi:energy-coupling factor transporter ATP-binding protein EcfA2